MVGEFLQCIKGTTNEVDKNAVAVIRSNFQCKEEVVGHMQQKFPWLYPCFYSCLLCLGHFWNLQTCQTWRWTRTGSFNQFLFDGPGQKPKKDRERLKQDYKTLSKVKCIQVCLIWTVTRQVYYREVSSRGFCKVRPENDVCYREVTPLKCPLHRSFVMRVWPSFHPYLRKVLLERGTCFDI